MNYCIMETRAMSHPATFDGLLTREITIQFIHDLLMTGCSCLRNTLSRGVSAYPASRVACISTSTRYSETLKRSNLNRHPRNHNISIYRIDRGLSIQIPGHPHLSNLGYPAQSCQCWPYTTMQINHRYRADTNRS